MKDKKDFADWESLFEREQKGRTPEELSYSPISSIQIPPYNPQSIPDSPNLGHGATEIFHSLWVDNVSARWIAQVSDQLFGYAIHSILGSLDQDSAELLDMAFQHTGSDRKLGKNTAVPHVLDLGKEDVLIEIRKWIKTYSERQELGIAFLPSHDFIWNVAMVRGIGKFLFRHFGDRAPLAQASIYTPLHTPSAPGDESRLISLTNQILSMMVSGIYRCIWDTRKANDWQKTNLNYFLNIPEILLREGKVFQDEDPIRGSGLFEELSDRIVNELIE